MKIKQKIIILLLFIFIVTNSVVYYISEENKNQRIKMALNESLNDLEIYYKIFLHYQKISADTSSESLLGMTKVIETLTKAQTASIEKKSMLKVDLYNIVKKKYKILKKKGITQCDFTLANNELFLRMENLSLSNNVNNIREDFKFVNNKKQSISTFSYDSINHGFRNTYPIYTKDGKYLGALGITFSSENFQENIVGRSKVHTHFLINKNIINKNIKNDTSRYIQSSENKDLMLKMSVYHSKKLCIEDNSKRLKNSTSQINKGMKKGEKFAVYTILQSNHADIVSFFPIKDINKTKTLAWFVSYKTSDFAYTTIKNTQFFRIILFFILLFLFYFIYRVLNQKEILNQLVSEKTFELEKLNENLEQTVKEEVEKNNQQQIHILEQSKKAQMGEMIENIAHQWRQPLSVISTASSGMQVQKEFDILTDEVFNESCIQINENVEYLSETITTFRNFLKEKKEIKNIVLQDDIKKAINITKTAIKNNKIKLETNIETIETINIKLVEGELPQVLINIINNAKDILVEKAIPNPFIEINLNTTKDKVTISIEDNAGGIPDGIILKIFDPYFTTKENSNGTGLGLNMSYKIITESLKGKIYVKNTNNGAKFFIELPLSK